MDDFLTSISVCQSRFPREGHDSNHLFDYTKAATARRMFGCRIWPLEGERRVWWIIAVIVVVVAIYIATQSGSNSGGSDGGGDGGHHKK